MDTVNRLLKAKRVVIKIGSAMLVDGQGLRKEWLRSLARDIADMKSRGTDVCVVSSGAIALGRVALGQPAKTVSIEQSQAAAAVGQIRLAHAYWEALAESNLVTAQVLLTLEDSENRRRYLNSRATFEALLAEGVVPIANENDTVATDEIRFGDNDRLAAQVAVMTGSDMLILLSDIDGYYDGNPRRDRSARRVSEIRQVTPEMEQNAGTAGSCAARGGMRTKLLAAKTAMGAGCAMIIADGHEMRPVNRLLKGTACSCFLPSSDPVSARKHWIASMKPKGTLVIDAGAAVALTGGKSLLPAGLTSLSGGFQRGDPVDIIAPENRWIARGLVRYDFRELEKIKGLRSEQIPQVLGYAGRSALVHRDDMAF